jgi:hypothetical protein
MDYELNDAMHCAQDDMVHHPTDEDPPGCTDSPEEKHAAHNGQHAHNEYP